MKRLLTILAVLGLLLAACGDDDDTAETDGTTESDGTTATDGDADEGDTGDDADGDGTAGGDYAAALAADLQDGSFPGTAEQIECLSEGYVEAIGGSQDLEAAGITPEELVTAESPQAIGLEVDVDTVTDDLVGTFETCEYDTVELLIEASGGATPDGFADCVRDRVSNDELAAVLARALADPGAMDGPNEVLAQLRECSQPSGEG